MTSRGTTDGTCSFCGKLVAEVSLLVTRPGGAICDECVKLAADILAEDTSSGGASSTGALIVVGAATGGAHEAACSLCHEPLENVTKLIAGPRVSICDCCVAGAHAEVGRRARLPVAHVREVGILRRWLRRLS